MNAAKKKNHGRVYQLSMGRDRGRWVFVLVKGNEHVHSEESFKTEALATAAMTNAMTKKKSVPAAVLARSKKTGKTGGRSARI